MNWAAKKLPTALVAAVKQVAHHQARATYAARRDALMRATMERLQAGETPAAVLLDLQREAEFAEISAPAWRSGDKL